jgi:outer membrane usher protein
MSHLKYGLDHLGSGEWPGSLAYSRRSPLPFYLPQAFSAQAELYFNPRFLADDPAAVADLSGFEKGQEVPPGTYRVDIYLNDGI